MTLDEALAYVDEHGFGDLVDADSIIEEAARRVALAGDRAPRLLSPGDAVDQGVALLDFYDGGVVDGDGERPWRAVMVDVLCDLMHVAAFHGEVFWSVAGDAARVFATEPQSGSAEPVSP